MPSTRCAMKSDFWDTSALLALQCGKDDFHAAAEAVFSGRCCAARRSRAEFYSAATGRMGIAPAIALTLLESLDGLVEWLPLSEAGEIGRASCRERVKISVVAVSLKKK